MLQDNPPAKAQPEDRVRPAPALEVVNLSKEFVPRRQWIAGKPKKIEAVRNVSFSLRAGEIFGLVGPNGAGKTTLIKMLTTLLEPTGGSIHIAGVDLARHPGDVRRMIGLVASNERSFYWRLTGYQNLLFFADLYRLPRSEAVPWIHKLVEMLSLTDRIHQRFDAYSTGMRQRLAMARGLLNKPRFLFMDEPTKGVDPIAAAEIVRLIKNQIVPQWQPVILVTSHNLSEIEKLCDRIAFMRRGQIVACGTLEELHQLASPRQFFEITFQGIDTQTALRAAKEAGAKEAHASPVEGNILLHVEFEPTAAGIGGVVGDLVRAGGIFVNCEAQRPTIDELFDRLVGTDAAGEH